MLVYFLLEHLSAPPKKDASKPAWHFIKPNPVNWTGYRFLTASDLMQSCKGHFGKQYNISAATMAHVVASSGKDSTVEARPPAGVHYNLTTGARHDQG